MNWIFLISAIFAFLISGIGPDTKTVSHVVIFISLTAGFLAIPRDRELRVPPHFGKLLLFSLILLIYPLFTSLKINPFFYSLLFAEGMAFWLVVFNLKSKILKYFPLLFFIPALLYSLFFLLEKLLNFNFLRLAQFFFIPDTVHQHIGDLWAVTLILSWPFFFLLVPPGLYFLGISYSRSAYAAIIIAIMYLLYRKKKIKKLPLIITAAVAGVLFIYKASLGSTLFSRPYFLQSILGFFKHPLGVGMGNFRTISLNYYYAGGSLGSFSEYTHNIFLEALSGIGIFALPFWIWGIKIIYDTITGKSKNTLWSAVFLAITVLFIFDSVYMIHGMIWLWFIALGMSQRSEREG